MGAPNFREQADELAKLLGLLSFTERDRIVDELEKAFVAGQSVAALELSRYQRALQIARNRGEHYPVCNMPPVSVRNDRIASMAWREQNLGRCDCWKSLMEEALR